jgi:GNAT superfamily N-acetyltransferase
VSAPIDGLRMARDEDGPALIVLIEGCWAEYPGCVMDVDGEEPWLRAPASAYASWQGRLWVVQDGGGVVACAGFKPHEPGVGELKSLYVAATARRRGLGASLTGLVEDTAAARGVRRLELWSDTRFAAAHRLYERLGYLRQPETRDLHDKSNTTEYHYVKELQ